MKSKKQVFIEEYENEKDNATLAKVLCKKYPDLFPEEAKTYVLVGTYIGRYIKNKPREYSLSKKFNSDIELRRLKTKNDELNKMIKHAQNELENAEKRYNTLITIKERVNSFEIENTNNDNKDKVVPILLLSDWHIEEKVEAETINSLNEYNIDIAKKRSFKCFQNFLKRTTALRSSYNIDEVFIWFGGDFITGYIHEELMENNYLSPTQATLEAKRLLISGVEFLIKHGGFKKIVIQCDYGNHGRTGKEKKFATGYKNSYEWMMYNDIHDYFRNEESVHINVNNGLINYYDLKLPNGNFKIRTWHGCNVKYQGGIGGLTIPLNKMIQRLDMTIKAQYNFMGHFHQYHEVTRNCICNGSVIGYNSYANNLGLAFEKPMQGMVLLDIDKMMVTEKFTIHV